MTNANRGEIYRVDMGNDRGFRPYVVVSYNARNRRLDTALGVMITTTDKSDIATAVKLTHEDLPFSGYAIADHIDELREDEVSGTPDGYLSRRTLSALNVALKLALGLQ